MMPYQEWIGISERGDTEFAWCFGMPGERGGIQRIMLCRDVLSLHARHHIEWEKLIYHFGLEHDLPFPKLLEVRNTSVLTELVGPSAKALLERDLLPHPLAENEIASIIIYTIHAAARIADAGVVPFDGHLNNYLVWLENGLKGGKLNFEHTLAMDHPYTMVRGLRAERPLWCNALMPHFAPEARPFKQADEDAFARHLRGLGFDGKSLGDMVRNLAAIEDKHKLRERRFELERAYEAYSAEMQLQRALDANIIEPHRIIQFSLAKCLLELLSCERPVPRNTRIVIAHIETILARMADVRPEARYPTLDDAAAAIEAVLGTPLSESVKSWPAIDPKFLIFDVRGGSDPTPLSSAVIEGEGTFSLDDPVTDDRPGMSEQPARNASWKIPPQTKPQTVSHARPKRIGEASPRNWKPIFAAIAILLVAGIVSLRVPLTPEEAVRSAYRVRVEKLVAQVEANTEIAESARKELASLLHGDNDEARKYAAQLVDGRFKKFAAKHLSASWLALGKADVVSSGTRGTENRRRVQQQLKRYASLDYEPAKKWLEAIQQTQRVIEDGVGNGARELVAVR